MDELTDHAIDAALERGREARLREPRVVGAHYDRASGRMVVDLTNGCTFAFPPRSLQGLESASDDEIAAVEVLGRGTGMHWDVGDADFTIAGLLAGRFGSRRYMEERYRSMRDAETVEPVSLVG